eukprot:gene14230-16790_t
MNKLFIVAVILCFTAPIFAEIWSSCGTASDHFTIGNVVITPDPPQKGQNINVTASGTLNEQVTSGNVALLVKYGFITLINKNLPLCEPANPFPCPLAAGPYEKSIVQMIPDAAPPGTYTAHVVVTDQNNQEIACINADFTDATAIDIASNTLYAILGTGNDLTILTIDISTNKIIHSVICPENGNMIPTKIGFDSQVGIVGIFSNSTTAFNPTFSKMFGTIDPTTGVFTFYDIFNTAEGSPSFGHNDQTHTIYYWVKPYSGDVNTIDTLDLLTGNVTHSVATASQYKSQDVENKNEYCIIDPVSGATKYLGISFDKDVKQIVHTSYGSTIYGTADNYPKTNQLFSIDFSTSTMTPAFETENIKNDYLVQSLAFMPSS